MAIVMAGTASLAQLVVISAAANRAAGATSIGLLLAEDKLEELRSAPAAPSPSPSDALFADTACCVDYLDAGGALYVRRWSVLPLPAGALDLLLLQVRVMPWPAAGRSKGQGEVRLVGLKRQEGG